MTVYPLQVGPFADADSLPQWAIALIVMGSCITLAIVMVLIAKAMHYYNLVMSPGACTYVSPAMQIFGSQYLIDHYLNAMQRIAILQSTQ